MLRVHVVLAGFNLQWMLHWSLSWGNPEKLLEQQEQLLSMKTATSGDGVHYTPKENKKSCTVSWSTGTVVQRGLFFYYFLECIDLYLQACYCIYSDYYPPSSVNNANETRYYFHSSPQYTIYSPQITMIKISKYLKNI